MDILNKIKLLQDERKWSNYQLSAETGVPQSTINNMYSRHTLPTINTLTAICNAFKISLSEFFSECCDSNLVLSEEEKNLVFFYRRLSENEKRIIKIIVKETKQ